MRTLEGDLKAIDEDDRDGAIAPFFRRAPRISREDVFQAADALLIQGDRPTIDRVRMKVSVRRTHIDSR